MTWLIAIGLIWLAWRYLRPAPKPVSRVAPLSAPEMNAMQVLGVAPNADADAIRDAHRRKIAQAHPDRGGSAELTRELNAARDLLLRRGA